MEDEPQKPKPTTDGKQTAGHSNSTRSKAKWTEWTSHSADDESSGSPSHLRPLRRQTRLGAKQAERNVGIINNDSDSDPIDSNAVDEYTSAEIALKNGLVLESLFRYVNRSDLLSCRVVNKQWQDEATKELRRRKLVIRFSFPYQTNELRRAKVKVCEDICRRLSECSRTPSLLSSFQVETVAPIDLGSAEVTNVFTTVGNQLKHLTLHLNYSMNTTSFEISSLETALHNLLFCQAPNLKFLEIKFDFYPRCEAELLTLDVFSQNQNDHNESRLLPNLKTFIVRGSPVPKFFVDVINAAVNLRSFGGDWSAWKEYLLGAEGRAKIHLVKSLSFGLLSCVHFQWDNRGLELVETFLTEQKENLQLETFECLPASRFYGSAALRAVGVINQILECSTRSLQKLIIEPAYWCEEAFIIPRLPQLQEICFDCVLSSEEMILSGGFFPQGFNMNTSFPNVSSIVLLSYSFPSVRLFLSRMEIEMTEPVPSIRYITANKKVKKRNIVPPHVTDFRHVFPNLVSISYLDNQKYYKIQAFP